ncbi:hypothetical protein VTN00DRAFT_4006 [Thermoascus crustaceus]|uniref:uncharacterized protein n=1 Tax=Thermoascus crustaceus TaxID=5088 RepID=UPI003744A47D
MDSLRRAAREYLKRADGDNIPDFIPDQTTLPEGLYPLWRDVLSHNSSNYQEACENLLIVQGFLRAWGPKTLSEDDVEAANAIYSWASDISLPDSEFAEVLEGAYSADEEKNKPLTDSLKRSRLRLSLGVSVLKYLSAFLPIQEADGTVDIVTTLASFTSGKDPWTTKWAREQALSALDSYVSAIRAENDALWSTLEEILKSKIKPLFAKTKNPAITAAGRKNLHPIPQPRFDSGMLDPETKPWKFQNVYATTLFAWIISQYQPSDFVPLEAHFPLLVPPILALIDDENLSFKTRGCNLLSQLLIPLREGKSDILRRTNLSSVFEDAVTPCLLSLPTITPENESIQLLGTAYPALLSVLKTRYQNATSSAAAFPDTRSSASSRTLSAQEDKEAHLRGVTSMLRTSLIPSFHHISSTTPTVDKSIASFPYPRLSTLLLDQLYTLVLELGIHATKYLQDIVPLLYTTLTNPFGTAHPPLLLAAVAAARAVVLNAHPRIWRWRGELLGALCECWLYVLEEEKQIAEQAERDRKRGREDDPQKENKMTEMEKLKKQLQGAVYLLKVAVSSIAAQSKDNNTVEGSSSPEENWAGVDAEIDMEKELEELVKADEGLRGLLFADFSPDDGEYF